MSVKMLVNVCYIKVFLHTYAHNCLIRLSNERKSFFKSCMNMGCSLKRIITSRFVCLMLNGKGLQPRIIILLLFVKIFSVGLSQCYSAPDSVRTDVN